MTNKGRHKRRFTDNPYCKICPEEIEDLNHIFKEYKRVNNFWECFMEKRWLDKTQGLTFWDCINWNLWEKTVVGDEGVWTKFFASCVWWTWT